MLLSILILIFKIILCFLVSFAITYVLTMFLFYVDLKIRQPFDKDKVHMMGQIHSKMSPYYFLISFVIMCYLFIIR